MQRTSRDLHSFDIEPTDVWPLILKYRPAKNLMPYYIAIYGAQCPDQDDMPLAYVRSKCVMIKELMMRTEYTERDLKDEFTLVELEAAEQHRRQDLLRSNPRLLHTHPLDVERSPRLIKVTKSDRDIIENIRSNPSLKRWYLDIMNSRAVDQEDVSRRRMTEEIFDIVIAHQGSSDSRTRGLISRIVGMLLILVIPIVALYIAASFHIPPALSGMRIVSSFVPMSVRTITFSQEMVTRPICLKPMENLSAQTDHWFRLLGIQVLNSEDITVVEPFFSDNLNCMDGVIIEGGSFQIPNKAGVIIPGETEIGRDVIKVEGEEVGGCVDMTIDDRKFCYRISRITNEEKRMLVLFDASSTLARIDPELRKKLSVVFDKPRKTVTENEAEEGERSPEAAPEQVPEQTPPEGG
ncbi:MAG: hypothetical protein ACOCXQ_00105 [Patescibacteria group bacterium]